MTFPFDMTQASPMNIFSSINVVTSLDALLWPSPSPMHYHCCHFSFLILFFWSTRVSQLIFCLLKPAPKFFLFFPISIIFWGFHGRDIFSHPTQPTNRRSYTPVLSCSASALLCSPDSHRNFLYLLHTHTSTQTSPFHSRLRALSCMFARSSKFHPIFFPVSFSSPFSLSLLLLRLNLFHLTRSRTLGCMYLCKKPLNKDRIDLKWRDGIEMN